MTWVKLSDTFAEDPRWDDLGPQAFQLHVAALCYCNRQLTDGALSRAAVRRLTGFQDPDAVAARLVEAGLWASTDGGFLVVDYLVDQPAAAEVRKRQESNKARQQAWRDRQKRGRDGVTNASRNALRDALVTPSVTPTPARPGPKEPGQGPTPSRGRSAARRCAHGALVASDGAACPDCSGEDTRLAIVQ